MSTGRGGTFRALRGYNYRTWAWGALVSNIGTWMQRTAQDWLVLTSLTHHNAACVGVVSGLQFGPQLLLLPWTGLAADRFDRRRLLLATQAVMGSLALCLGVLAVTGLVRLWHVYVFAFLLGCAAAFDVPARQSFVSDLVPEGELSNAVALNSTSFNAARMVGPAVAGLVIAGIGSGWVFLANALSYGAVILSLSRLRLADLTPVPRRTRTPRDLGDGFRYVAGRADLRTILLMLFVFGTFGLNFPIFISTMAVSAFHLGPGRYGVLISAIAIGSVSGALMSARRERPGFAVLVSGALVFGAVMALAALMPGPVTFGAALFVIGAAAQTVTTTANGLVQLSTEAAMRGRVMALYVAVAVGGTPLGAPLVGWVANACGPRWAVGVGALAGAVTALIGAGLLPHGLPAWRRARKPGAAF